MEQADTVRVRLTRDVMFRTDAYRTGQEADLPRRGATVLYLRGLAMPVSWTPTAEDLREAGPIALAEVEAAREARRIAPNDVPLKAPNLWREYQTMAAILAPEAAPKGAA